MAPSKFRSMFSRSKKDSQDKVQTPAQSNSPYLPPNSQPPPYATNPPTPQQGYARPPLVQNDSGVVFTGHHPQMGQNGMVMVNGKPGGDWELRNGAPQTNVIPTTYHPTNYVPQPAHPQHFDRRSPQPPIYRRPIAPGYDDGYPVIPHPPPPPGSFNPYAGSNAPPQRIVYIEEPEPLPPGRGGYPRQPARFVESEEELVYVPAPPMQGQMRSIPPVTMPNGDQLVFAGMTTMPNGERKPQFMVIPAEEVERGRRVEPVRIFVRDESPDSEPELFTIPVRGGPPGSRRQYPPGRVIEGNGYDSDDEPRVIYNPASDSRFSSRAPSPEPTPDEEGEVNLNRRYDHLPESMVPFWYNKRPKRVGKDSPHYLCATCRRIDFRALFRQDETDTIPKPRDCINLGTLISMAQKQECGFCQLVPRIVATDAGRDLPTTLTEDERKDILRVKLTEMMQNIYYLCPVRFSTTYNIPALYLYNSKELTEASKQSSVFKQHRCMAVRPFSGNEPNTGRRIKNPEVIDFEWIRERIQMCEARDIQGPNRFDITIRAIDIDKMCIVDLEHGARYVTLSYTWGQANQLKLERANEETFRQPGALRTLLGSIPKTIRDSITLVEKIGERYLWVDALCIIQDCPEDKDTQIGAMGDIYRHCLFTLCACCGEDASYGLPGIEPGTRTTRQVISLVGDIVLGNMMPDSEPIENSKWYTRAWTLQENALSQRKLQISDTGVRWWCWHTITPEDQHCRHPYWKEGTPHSGMYFFKTEDDRVVSKIEKNSNFDIYAFIISDYTSRNLTWESDAEKAILGVFNEIDGLFRGRFVWGIPDTELVAGLLWHPVGQSKRRVEPKTGNPLFPSWSWLGWSGVAVYPWLIERTTPMSEFGSPLRFRNIVVKDDSGAPDDEMWITGDDYRGMMTCRVTEMHRWRPDKDGWSYIDEESEAHRWLHPVLEQFFASRRGMTIATNFTHRLHLRTLLTRFTVDQKVHQRKENYDYSHKVHFARVRDSRGFCAGQIFLPDPETLSAEEKATYTPPDMLSEFIVLSRASTNPDPRIGRDILHNTPMRELASVYSMPYSTGRRGEESEEEEEEHLDPLAQFDTRVFDDTTPWGLFNVLIVERRGEVVYRRAVGRVHVAAFMGQGAWEEEFLLE
ncbi:HET-domain-containing protein [Patellaria atrata CBS 101060]|uniref:HET-domain-containing protein n=1 Tax=Patellaria atrata CBS 101060 TaxID=1346257 RepID=A0A9P4S6A8_9PEZI|nr:HET-domain-containing protein [Patellaria atrata CBS 101060]